MCSFYVIEKVWNITVDLLAWFKLSNMMHLLTQSNRYVGKKSGSPISSFLYRLFIYYKFWQFCEQNDLTANYL